MFNKYKRFLLQWKETVLEYKGSGNSTTQRAYYYQQHYQLTKDYLGILLWQSTNNQVLMCLS
jgi:hypothetical protein